MKADRHKHLGGKKYKHYSLDECLTRVREKYPSAWMEGSAGLGRSFYVKVEKRRLMVADAWSSGRYNKDFEYTWFVRVFDEPKEW